MLPWRVLLRCCVVPLLLAAKCESTSDDEEDEDSGNSAQVVLQDKFTGATFAAHWTQAGPGTMFLENAVGLPEPSAALDPSGTACELESDVLGPIFPDWQAIRVEVQVAISSSAASATVAIEDSGGSDLASVTISDGQVLVVTPGTYSVTQLWTTDSNFHTLEFLLYPNGYCWWVRKHNGVEQISPGGTVGAVTGIRVSLRGASPDPAWFDNVEAFVFGRTN